MGNKIIVSVEESFASGKKKSREGCPHGYKISAMSKLLSSTFFTSPLEKGNCNPLNHKFLTGTLSIWGISREGFDCEGEENLDDER